MNGVSLKGMSVAEVGGVIRSCPQEFIATVRPVSALKKHRHNAPKGSYASRMSHIDYFSTPPISPTQVTTPTSDSVFNHANGNCATPTLTIRPPTPDLPSNESPPPNAPPPSDSPPLIVTSDEGSLCSNDDMGDYDDDDDTDY